MSKIINLSLPCFAISTLCVFITTNALAKPSTNDQDLDISGYIMLDSNTFDSAFAENSDESDSLAKIRRARLSFKTQLTDNWNTKFQLGFAGGEAEIKDAYLQYKGWKWADITIGQQKEAFGLEKLTSSRNLLMVERSISTEAIAPGRSMGISATGKYSSINWNIGYYQPDETESASAITGRLTWVPWQQNHNLLHVGGSFSERDHNGSEYRINEPMEVYFSDSLIEGEKLFANNISQQGIELLWLQNNFSLMAEWQQSKVTDVSDNTYNYQGGYVQMSYLLSGGHKKYKNGVLGASTGKGWELTSRFSQFELDEENEKTSIYSLGVNYSVNKKLKFMADYINTDRYIDNINIESGNAVALRVQYSF
jgi:phosphate-selective porin OprO/OprP